MDPKERHIFKRAAKLALELQLALPNLLSFGIKGTPMNASLEVIDEVRKIFVLLYGYKDFYWIFCGSMHLHQVNQSSHSNRRCLLFSFSASFVPFWPLFVEPTWTHFSYHLHCSMDAMLFKTDYYQLWWPSHQNHQKWKQFHANVNLQNVYVIVHVQSLQFHDLKDVSVMSRPKCGRLDMINSDDDVDE